MRTIPDAAEWCRLTFVAADLWWRQPNAGWLVGVELELRRRHR